MLPAFFFTTLQLTKSSIVDKGNKLRVLPMGERKEYGEGGKNG